MKKYYRIWLPLISILVFLAAAELICRGLNLTDKLEADFSFYVRQLDNDIEHEFMIEDALLMWRPRPDYQDQQIQINSRGLRDQEYELEKGAGVFRILCLGDSATFGFGLYPEKVYHSLLENKLNQNAAFDIKFEVINGGSTGYSSLQGLNLYQHYGVKYAPDIVTCYFGGNDHFRRFYLSDKDIMQGNIPQASRIFKNRVLLKSHFYRVMRKLVLTGLSAKHKKERENVPRVSIEEYQANILAFNRLCRKNNSVLILIATPICKESKWPSAQDIIFYRRTLERLAAEHKLHLVSIKEMTEQAPDETQKFFIDSYHPNELGHKLIMEKIYDYLLANKLAPIAE
ncbi:SGNH/GDSL hydrolase family protein [Candidatus Omnitrophota bacterium]